MMASLLPQALTGTVVLAVSGRLSTEAPGKSKLTFPASH